MGERFNITIGDYFGQIIERLEKVEKYGSASKHKTTVSLMRQSRSVDIHFDQIDMNYLKEFEIFLRQRHNQNNKIRKLDMKQEASRDLTERLFWGQAHNNPGVRKW